MTRHRYQVWTEGTLGREVSDAIAVADSRPVGRFTVFAADLDAAGIFELLDQLESFALEIVGVARDGAILALPPKRTSREREYDVRLTPDLDAAVFEDLAVTVMHDAGTTRVFGSLDQSALHGLLRRAQLHDAELIALTSTTSTWLEE